MKKGPRVAKSRFFPYNLSVVPFFRRFVSKFDADGTNVL